MYDHSHLGHARTYISFDIIRRLLEDYFSYNLLYVMNITDIDDKIIISARQQHLFKQFMLNFDPAVVSTALDYYVELRFGKYGASVQDWPAFKVKVEQQQLTSDDAKFKLYVDNVDKCLECIGSTTVDEKYYSNCKEVVKSYLDSLYGNSVTDQQIYKEFTLYWEQDYFKNMDRLNIKRPDVLTRVTEYVPEVVEYCQKIIDNGFAYESNGSLYFDVLKFNDSGHDYAKLAPWAASNLKLLQEGEGDLADGSGKRNSSDFALWKASKQGEPFWPSPWGNGRPGWHIECSVMASCVLGSNMDVHCGGIDLQFPHHDNELAQSEAYYDCKQWVNYFLHSGHLHIENLKMSKSLKNFITINVSFCDDRKPSRAPLAHS